MEKLIEELASIWTVKGSHPEYHDQVKSELQKKWPLLYGKIEEIVKAK